MTLRQPSSSLRWLSFSGPLRLTLAALAALAGRSLAAAAPTPAGAATDASRIEIVVLEAPGCIYCDIFRSDVKPAYEASPTARTAPLRFIDLNDEAADKLDLTGGPVDIVPTFVVMKDHKEVARIPGYVGRENFFRTLNTLLPGLQ